MPTGIYKHKRGESNHRWKGGLPKCHCGKVLSNYKAVTCIKHMSLEHRQKLSDTHKVARPWRVGVPLIKNRGENHPRWVKDRTKLKRFNDDIKDRRSSAYVTWRKEVWLRDSFKCKIANPDCKGRIEAHHILSWRDYPELRYELKNGITLCQFHHPKKRDEEEKLSPYFQELVNKVIS